MKNWIKRKLGVANLIWLSANHEARIKRLEELVEIGIDLHFIGESWVVTCIKGKEGGVDFVRFYRLPSNEVSYIRELCSKLEKEYHTRAKVDCPLAIKEYLKW